MDYADAHHIQPQATDADTSRNFTYGHSETLSSFMCLMSGHGRPVCASMMLSNPDYARDQLRRACTIDDQALQQLAVSMLSALPRPSTDRSPGKASAR